MDSVSRLVCNPGSPGVAALLANAPIRPSPVTTSPVLIRWPSLVLVAGLIALVALTRHRRRARRRIAGPAALLLSIGLGCGGHASSPADARRRRADDPRHRERRLRAHDHRRLGGRDPHQRPIADHPLARSPRCPCGLASRASSANVAQPGMGQDDAASCGWPLRWRADRTTRTVAPGDTTVALHVSRARWRRD